MNRLEIGAMNHLNSVQQGAKQGLKSSTPGSVKISLDVKISFLEKARNEEPKLPSSISVSCL